MLAGNLDLTSIGLSIQSVTIIILFGGLFIVPQARTKRNLPVYSVFIFIGFLLIIGEFLTDPNRTLILYISILLFIFWFLYLYWYSVLEKRSDSNIGLGSSLPDVHLENTDNIVISLRSFIGSPTIFMFYRGNWCPLCMAQIKEIADQYKELKDLGVNIVLISPQPNRYSKTLAEKYDLGFHFLTDVDHMAAKRFGILTKNGIPAGFQLLGYDSDTVLPTIIIIDDDGKVIFREVADNYRVRPEPDTFMRVIRENR